MQQVLSFCSNSPNQTPPIDQRIHQLLAILEPRRAGDPSDHAEAQTVPDTDRGLVVGEDEVEDGIFVALFIIIVIIIVVSRISLQGVLDLDLGERVVLTSFGAYSRYVSPMTLPMPLPREDAQVRKPALQMWEQRPVSIPFQIPESVNFNIDSMRKAIYHELELSRETHQDNSASHKTSLDTPSPNPSLPQYSPLFQPTQQPQTSQTSTRRTSPR